MPKTKITGLISTFLLCYAFWILLTWSFDVQELIAGAIVALVAALVSSKFFIHEDAFWLLRPKRLLALIAYVLVIFPIELVKANVDMAKRCFGGCKNINPGIVKVPVELKGLYSNSMLANSITLTPGTITLDIAEEDGKTYYYIHWIDVSTEDRVQAGEIIKGTLEKWTGRIWEK